MSAALLLLQYFAIILLLLLQHFLDPAITITITFEKVIDYITNYFSIDGTKLTGFNDLTIPFYDL